MRCVSEQSFVSETAERFFKAANTRTVLQVAAALEEKKKNPKNRSVVQEASHSLTRPKNPKNPKNRFSSREPWFGSFLKLLFQEEQEQEEPFFKSGSSFGVLLCFRRRRTPERFLGREADTRAAALEEKKKNPKHRSVVLLFAYHGGFQKNPKRCVSEPLLSLFSCFWFFSFFFDRSKKKHKVFVWGTEEKHETHKICFNNVIPGFLE